MTPQLLNAIRLIVERTVAQHVGYRVGNITAYDPKVPAVKVRIQPDDLETGWMPLASIWVGDQWGLFAAPSIGDQVEVHFDRGHVETGYATLRMFSQDARPLSVESGEFWLVHRSGSALKLTNDGKVLVKSIDDMNFEVGGNAIWKIEKDMQIQIGGDMTTTVTGNIKEQAQQVELTANSYDAKVPQSTFEGQVGVQQTMTAQAVVSNSTVVASSTVSAPAVIAGAVSLSTHVHPNPEGGFVGPPV